MSGSCEGVCLAIRHEIKYYSCIYVLLLFLDRSGSISHLCICFFLLLLKFLMVNFPEDTEGRQSIELY